MTTAVATASGPRATTRRGPLPPLTRRALRDARARTLGFGCVFAALASLQPVGYRHTYPTLADRLSFAHSFAHNKAVELLYGKAYDLVTVGGYTAWRVGGTLAVFAALFGLLGAVRALRAEEDAGRAELVLSGCVGRVAAFGASLMAVAAGVVFLFAAAFTGFVVGGLPAGGSAYLALAIASVAPVFAGVGALVSQLAPSKRTAIELGGALVGVCFLLRVIADTAPGAGWVDWLTPFGWAEELRAFSGAHALVLVLPLATSVLALWTAARLATRRDLGLGMLSAHEQSRPRLGLLSSSTMQALRSERIALAVWVVSVTALGLVIGVVSKSVSGLGISKQLEHALAKLGAGSGLTPKAYIGFSFGFFVLAISVLAVSQIAAARHEEADGRVQTIFSLPVSRQRWLSGRLALGAAAVLAVSICAAASTWIGAGSQGVAISASQMLLAGINCLPVAILFLGIAALAYGVAPRAGTAIAYGLLIAAYLWQLIGTLLGAPGWLKKLTPFAHVGLVPARPFGVGAALVMLGIGLAAGLGAVAPFKRRDLADA